MPQFYTKDFANKVMFFSLRPSGLDQPAGFYARPLFTSKEAELTRKCQREGRAEQAWIEFLVYALDGWEGFYDMKGKAIPFSGENVRQLCESDQSYMRAVLHILRGADNATWEDTRKN